MAVLVVVFECFSIEVNGAQNRGYIIRKEKKEALALGCKFEIEIVNFLLPIKSSQNFREIILEPTEL